MNSFLIRIVSLLEEDGDDVVAAVDDDGAFSLEDLALDERSFTCAAPPPLLLAVAAAAAIESGMVMY